MSISATDPTRTPAAPVWCLPAGALLAAIALSPFLPGFLAMERAQARARAAFAARNGDEGRAAPGTRWPVRVFAVGDSMLRFAVRSDEEMAREGRRFGLDLTWRQVGRPGRQWDSASVFEAAVASRPDFLIVGRNLLFYTPRSAEPLAVPLLPFRLLESNPPSASARFVRHVRSVLKADWGLHVHQAVRRHAYGSPDDRYLRGFELARRQGTQVILVDLPTHPAARLALPEPPEVEDWLKPREAEGSLLVWRCPISFDPEEFHDAVHLNEWGRIRYSRWLLQRLNESRGAHPAPDTASSATAR